MNWFANALPLDQLDAYSTRLCGALLHFVWQGAVIGLLLWLALRWLQESSAERRYFASAVALLSMAACFPITLAVHAYSQPRSLAHVDTASVQSNASIFDEVNQEAEQEEESDAAPTASRTVDTETSERIAHDSGSGSHLSDSLIRRTESKTSWSVLSQACAGYVTKLYVFGVIVMLLRLSMAVRNSGRLRSNSQAVEESHFLATVRQQAKRLGMNVAPAVAYCDRIAAPAVIGIVRPVILLPPSIITGLSTQQIEALLAHELAHIRRHDLLFILVQRLVESMLFFHPVVWYVSRQLHAERENCCDDLVLSIGWTRIGYADALIRMAEICSVGKPTCDPSLSAGAAKNPTDLKRRVLRLLGTSEQVHSHLWLPRSSFFCLIALTIALTLAPLTASNWLASENRLTAAETDASSPDRAALLALAQQDQFQDGTVETLEPISGTVRSYDGHLIAGAKVYLRESPISSEGWGRKTPTDSRDLASTQTDSDGHFRFENVKSQPLHRMRENVLPVDLIVAADGYAVAWQKLKQFGVADFRLQPEGKIEGRVFDESTKPATGVSVRVLRFLPLTEIANMDLARREYPRSIGNMLDLAHAGFRPSATVDALGNFELKGLPKNSGVVLAINDPRYYKDVIYTTANPNHPVWRELATLSAPVATSYVAPSPYAREKSADTAAKARAEFGLRESVQVSPIEISLHRGNRLRVRVVDDQTGAPVPGARFPEPPVLFFPPRGVADSKGAFEYTQLTPGQLNVGVMPPEQSQWIGSSSTVSLPDEPGTTEVEVRLHHGGIVSGKVIDATTGFGIADVAVYSSGSGTTKTDETGHFQLVTPIGRVTLWVRGNVIGYQAVRQKGDVSETVAQSVEASFENPVTNVVFELQPDTLFHGRTVDPQGKPIGGVQITGKKNERYVGDGLTYTPIDQQSDGEGRYVLTGMFANVSRIRSTGTNVLFHDELRSLAAEVRFEPPSSDSRMIEKDIQMLKAGVVTGRVVNSETNEPVADVSVRVSLWSGDSGRHLGGTKTDAQGRFAYRCLIPGGEHTLNYRVDGFVPTDGRSAYSQHFTVTSDETFSMPDFYVTPKAIAESTADIPKLQPPSIEGLDAETAFATLQSQFEKDQSDYQTRIKAAKNRLERTKIVSQLEPNSIYAHAFMQLAGQHPDSDIELKSLVWVCDASVIGGADTKKLYLQKEDAAKRLIEKYIDRKEIAPCLGSLVYRSGTPHRTAELLMRKSPHREVQGLACLLAAEAYERDLDIAHRVGQEPSEQDRQAAIKYYKQVIADYTDLPEWRHGTIGKKAEQALRELQDLWVGQPAPEIVGEDLRGKPLKLSDYRGKIVILAFSHDISWWASLEATLEQYDQDQVVVVGVYAGDDDRESALAEATEQGIPWPIWFDAPRDSGKSIVSQWNKTSWPNAHVIDQQGIIRYRNLDRSRLPAAIEAIWRP